MNPFLSTSIRALVRPVVRLQLSAPVARSVQARNLHVTGVFYKKKSVSQDGDDADAFEDQGDLFASPGDVQAETKHNLSRGEPKGSTGKLELRRSERFQLTKAMVMNHPAFVLASAERNPEKARIYSIKIPIRRLQRMCGPRRALLAKMITIAATRAELLEFVDIFMIYRKARWPIDDLMRVDFIGRCIHLKAPDIALAILYHRPIFGFDIPTLTSARALMRSLLSTPHPPPGADEAPLPENMTLPTNTPLAHALLLANLYDIYALPPAATDHVTRALLLGAGAQQLKAGTDTEDASTMIQLVRESVENQGARPKGVVLNAKDLKVKDGKLVATSQALKERGKSTSEAAQARTTPLYNDELTASERTWIKERLDKFVEWAQEQGEDTAWVDKLKVA